MVNIFDAITSPLKAASESAEKLLELGSVIKHGNEIREMHQLIVVGLKAARDAEVEKLTMQDEIDRLKREVADLKANKAKLERYELKRLPPGVFVMALKENVQPPEPAHYACENCFGSGVVRRLHGTEPRNGVQKLTCNGCGAEIETGQYTPPKPARLNTRYNPFQRR